MNILVTGGCGSVGTFLTKHFLNCGHHVRIMDPRASQMKEHVLSDRLMFIEAGTWEIPVLQEVVQGIDIIVHCAWSFAEQAEEIVQQDIKGTVCLLESAVKCDIKLFCNLSSAIVYGVPLSRPINEQHPCLIEDARKPIYALGKFTTEKLCQIYANSSALTAVSLRFWWGFGEEISGKHIRNMINTARTDAKLVVPGEAGGSFLYFQDLANILDRMIEAPVLQSGIYNVASLYITWEEIANLVKEVVGRDIKVESIPGNLWQGSSFLTDSWELDSSKIRAALNYEGAFTGAEYRNYLKLALANCASKIC